MKKFVSIMILLMILCVGSGSVFADPNGHPGTDSMTTTIVLEEAE